MKVNRRNDYQHDHDRFVCNYCGETFKGKSGLGVHLRRTENMLHPDIGEDDEIDYSQHFRFPATSDGRILIPDEKYRDLLRLDEDEQAEFEVVVNDDLLSIDEIEIEGCQPDPDEVLDDIRDEFKDRMMHDDQMSWVDAYQVIEDRLKGNRA